MMLRHSFNETEAAAAIDTAVATAITAGHRTGDIFSPEDPNAQKASTTQMGDAIAAAI
jgi:3-isopropylmalate dehydrogenase